MSVESNRVETTLSFYLYGLIGLSLLVFISSLIVVAVPTLIILGPVGILWRIGQERSPRIGARARWWLVVASLLVLAAPVVPAVWPLLTNESGASTPSIWLLLAGAIILPFPIAAITYLMQCRSSGVPTGER